MKALLFKLYIYALSRLTGTGLGQLPPIKWAYKHLRQMLLPKTDVCLEVHGLKMFMHGSGDYEDSDETMFTNGYERLQTQWFNRMVKEGMTVVDIGANIGYYTLLACRKVGQKGKVYAFEPEQSNYQLLVKNIERNSFKSAIPLQKAVCDKTDKIKLFLSSKGHGEHNLYDSENTVGQVMVGGIRLDDCINDKVDVIKMDVEGAEISALMGMKRTLKNNDNLKLFVEFYPPGLKRSGYEPEMFWGILRDCGFKYVYIFNEKTRKLELGGYESAVAYCKHHQGCCGDEAISAANLLCSKMPVDDFNVALLGAYPPPYGGLSVHVQRLKERLGNMGIPCKVYSYTKTSESNDGVVNTRNRVFWYLRQLFSRDKSVLHCHGYSPLALACLSVLSLVRRKRIILTTHGFLFKSNRVALWHRIAFWLASVAGIYFVITSPQVRKRILSLGIKPKNMTLEIVSAFIPPSGKMPDVSEEVKHFVELHRPLVVANAYKIVFFKGVDLYGLDMCVELVARLKAEHPDIGLVFSLPDIGDYEYFHKIQQEIRDKGISKNILIVNYPCEFYPILKRCDVFVRPTCVDDYGVSIAEAIYFGVPAVASDVCQRTEGTVLFKSRDMDDFTHKVREVLSDYGGYKESLQRVKFGDTVGELIDVYRRV